MRLRAVVAFATLIGGLGLAGWAAAGIGSWNVSAIDANDDADGATGSGDGGAGCVGPCANSFGAARQRGPFGRPLASQSTAYARRAGAA